MKTISEEFPKAHSTYPPVRPGANYFAIDEVEEDENGIKIIATGEYFHSMRDGRFLTKGGANVLEILSMATEFNEDGEPEEFEQLGWVDPFYISFQK